MNDPQYATASSLAGLARELEALRRELRTVRGLPARVEDLARLITQAAESAATAPVTSARSWLALPHDQQTAQDLLEDLTAWVAQIYVRYPDGAARLPECWLWHPDLVEELLWLMCAWHGAYQVDGAPVSLAGDWHDRYRPGVVRRIDAVAGRCSPEVHHTPPTPLCTPDEEDGGPDRRLVGRTPRPAPARPGARRRGHPVAAESEPAVSARNVGRTARWTTLIAGLAVGLGAGVATAHGLYEVAVAAGAPKPIACLYPLICDGLALVAYASTARLSGGGRGYAWTVVVLAAGLSGLAQASFLAGGVPSAPPALRFGVGAWPAIAAAVVAHLIFLLGNSREVSSVFSEVSSPFSAVSNASSVSVQSAGQLDGRLDTRVDTALDGWTDGLDTDDREQPSNRGDVQPSSDPLDGVQPPVRARARKAALDHLARFGDLPTVRQLVELADVSRGSAAEALKELRATVGRLHLVTPENPKEDAQ